MATYSGRIRKGLPRDSSGEPWPPADQAAIDAVAAAVASTSAASAPSHEPPAAVAEPIAPTNEAAPAAAEVSETDEGTDVVRAAEALLAEAANGNQPGQSTTAPTATATPTAPTATTEVALRQGLPRERGGEPWPPAGNVEVSSVRPTRAANTGDESAAAAAAAPAAEPASAVATAQPSPATTTSAPATNVPTSNSAVSSASAAINGGAGEALRRGLPRVKGGEPWPPAGNAPIAPKVDNAPAAPVAAAETKAPSAPAVAPTAGPRHAAATPTDAVPAATANPAQDAKPAAKQEPAAPVAAAAAAAPAAPPASPAPVAAKPVAAKPVAASTPAKAQPKPVKKEAKKEPKKFGSRTIGQWARLVVLIAVGAVAAAGIIILAARGLTTFSAVENFLAKYPGEYALPATAEEGFPAWVRWSHFLNMFFIVLIIRSGLLVRHQQKPPAFWAPKNGKGSKISINLWLHQSLDVLWLLNGIVFVVLLFVTSHWMRIVPTSWDVFPNALSAFIQYLTLEWPAENGWVNYNSLQQLMYFTVVFIAAPLAAITGARLSDMWPKGAKRLNKIYPVELARALHFPTMLFFVVFVISHVALVFATGALANLNHMYAGVHEISWTGFWLFAGSIAIVALIWVASRPMLLAPVASLFGKVSSR